MVVKLGRVSHEATQHSDVAMTIPGPDEIRAKGLGTWLSAVPSFRTTFMAWWRKSTSRAQDLEQALAASLHDTIERSKPEHRLAR